MSTLTGTSHPSQPRAVHAGLNVVESDDTWSVTATAASTFLIAKIPNYVTVTDAKFYFVDGGADQTWKAGYQAPDGSATPSAFLADSSVSGITGVFSADLSKLPVRISATATEGADFVWITVTNTAAAISASANVKCVITYRKN